MLQGALEGTPVPISSASSSFNAEQSMQNVCEQVDAGLNEVLQTR